MNLTIYLNKLLSFADGHRLHIVEAYVINYDLFVAAMYPILAMGIHMVEVYAISYNLFMAALYPILATARIEPKMWPDIGCSIGEAL